MSGFLCISPARSVAFLIKSIILIHQGIHRIYRFMTFRCPVIIIACTQRVILVKLIVQRQHGRNIFHVILCAEI